MTKHKPAVSIHGAKFQAERFNEALVLAMVGGTEGLTGKEMYAKVNECIQEAAVGTTHEKQTLEYPRRVAKLKDFNTTDKQARTWKKRINGAIKAREDARRGTTTLDKVAKALKKVGATSVVPLWETKAEERAEAYDNLQDIAEAAREGETGVTMAEETGRRLKAQKQMITAYLSAKT